MDALIGYTGFVGSTLVRQHAFAGLFNSRNIDDATDEAFATVVCAAAPGSMFEANRSADRDAARITTLIEHLDAIGPVKRFVLVSTVAVLSGFAAEDEDTTAFETVTPYGINRRRLEEFVSARFPKALVVRLPALFGPGLKKNFLFDLMNPMPSMVPPAGLEQLCAAVGSALAATVRSFYPLDVELGMHVINRDALDASGKRAALDDAVNAAGLAAVRFTNPASRFQFYDMADLWRDIGMGLANDIGVLHLAPPPIAAGDVHRALLGEPMPDAGARVHAEDMRTRHAGLWGERGRYIARPDAVITRLRQFVTDRRIAA